MKKKDLFKKKICVVDDDETIREIYKIKLRENGFKVVTAEDGRLGFLVIKREKPDLALIDINMPNKNGIELVKEIRADEDLSKMKIIILTNDNDKKTIKKIEDYETCFYIVKAWSTPQKVINMVIEALG